MTPVEILRGAKVELATRGWKQGAYGSGHGPVCLIGACGAAAGVLTTCSGLAGVEVRVDPFLRAAMAAIGARERHPADWNDYHGRTVDDVQALLDRAIALAGGK